MPYLGGKYQTRAEKDARVEKRLRPLPSVYLGGAFRCKCHQSSWVRYRARFYCRWCGRRWMTPDFQYEVGIPDPDLRSEYMSFREAFEQAEKERDEKQRRTDMDQEPLIIGKIR
jgi:hypothetical protein